MTDTQSVVFQAPETGSEAPVQDNAQTPAPKPVSNDRPAWLPEKFKDPEQLALAYGELEKRLGTGTEEKPAEEAEAKPEVDPKAATPEVAKTQLAEKGLNIENFSAEFAREGKLSEGSYETLAKAGFSKGIVDGYVAGQRALADAYVGELLTAVGGQEQFATISTWAATALSEEAKEAFNATVNGGNKEGAKLAIIGLKAQYDEANGVEPSLIGGKPGSGSEAFRSRYEQTAAMRDPRYGKDPAYTKDIQEKSMRSFG